MSNVSEMKRLGYTCFCGGEGTYTDYNCGTSFEITCPHCRGSGIKCCACFEVSLKCVPVVSVEPAWSPYEGYAKSK